MNPNTCCTSRGTVGLRAPPRERRDLWTVPYGFAASKERSLRLAPVPHYSRSTFGAHGHLTGTNHGIVTFELGENPPAGNLVVVFTQHDGRLSIGDVAFTLMENSASVASGGFPHFTIYNGRQFVPLARLDQTNESHDELPFVHADAASKTIWLSVSLQMGQLTWAAGRGNVSIGQNQIDMATIPCSFKPAPLKHFHFLFISHQPNCVVEVRDIRVLDHASLMNDSPFTDEA